nr:uncharacterized protein LOC117221027 [Megalopta genalis]
MEDKGCLSSELESIIDEFSRIRDAYVSLKAYSDVQGESLMMERQSLNKMKENFEKLSQSYALLEKRYKSMMDEFNTEKQNMQGTIQELREQCDHLRLVVIDRNGDDGQVCNLENEITALKAELVAQAAKHKEEIAILKQAHSDELLRYHVLLQNAKLEAASDENKKQKRQRKPGNNEKENVNGFRWPELSIERISTAPRIVDVKEVHFENVGTKKRRLYRENDEDAVSLV